MKKEQGSKKGLTLVTDHPEFASDRQQIIMGTIFLKISPNKHTHTHTTNTHTHTFLCDFALTFFSIYLIDMTKGTAYIWF